MFQELENKIKQWCKEAGEDVSYEFLEVGHCNEMSFWTWRFLTTRSASLTFVVTEWRLYYAYAPEFHKFLDHRTL